MRTIAALLFVTTMALAQEPASPPTKPQDAAPPPPKVTWTGMLDEEQFAKLHTLTAAEAPKLNGEMVAIGESRHYLSVPRNQRPPFPAVILVHEWWGLNDHIKHWADRLAADGYVALAVDLYGGKIATTTDDAMKAMKVAAADVPKAVATMRAAFDFLGTSKRVEASRRAVLGWCFGGGMALQFAIAEPRLDATVMYYGRTVTEKDQLAAIHGPVLSIFGTKDQSLPQPAVDAFAKAMKDAGRTCTVLRYEAEHAFANPSGKNYDADHAGKAWTEVRAFLRQQLKNGSPAPAPVKTDAPAKAPAAPVRNATPAKGIDPFKG